jgi:hypothetical protein
MPPYLELKEELQLIKKFGFNGLHLTNNLPTPVFLQLCDELGLLLIIQQPQQLWSPTNLQVLQEWPILLENVKSHVSLLAYQPSDFNQPLSLEHYPGQGQALALALRQLTLALDPQKVLLTQEINPHTFGLVLLPLRTLEQHLQGGSFPSRQAVLLSCHWGKSTPWETLSFTDDGEPGIVENEPQYLLSLKRFILSIKNKENVTGVCFSQLIDTVEQPYGLMTSSRLPKILPSKIKKILDLL